MDRNITLKVIILMFFAAWFNSAPIYTSYNKAPDGYSKSVFENSRTIWVPDNHTTIQEAINNADEGDTVFVRAGTYYEHVIVDKALSLVGENKHDTAIDGNGTGIVVYVIANNITLSGFTIQNGGLGIWVSRSSNNILTNNTASNNSNGIYFWWSSNNVLTGNTASNNEYGIHFLGSSNNVLAGNIALNNHYGIHLDSSGYNTLTGNNVSSNYNSGVLLYHSSNNVLAGNIALNNHYGIYLSDSDNNVLTDNIALNNQYGIYLFYSRDNILTGITATNNYYGIRLTSSSNNNALTGNNVSSNYYGIRLTSSSSNIICHNNFISDTEPASSIDSINYWDYGVEGNYWSDYDGDDANLDGIGDTPYPIYENNRDNYPLMATFSQFTIVKENHSYMIYAISSSTISNLQYRYGPYNKTSAVSFEVNDAEGEGFCRISIAHALIEPPYTVKVDQKSPLYFEIVYTNGTHTWLYFTYDPLEHEVTIMHKLYPEQLVLPQWTILGLLVITVILLLISTKYYRMFKKQKKVIRAYERELGSFPVSHSERARLRFVKDVIERKDKIEKFKEKYGIKIQPAGTLEDLMEKLGAKKKVNH